MKELIQSQRQYFLDCNTRPLKTRKETLRKLYHLLLDNEQMLAIENELSLPYGKIKHNLSKLKRWAAPKYARTNLVNFPAASRYYQVPPWSMPGDWTMELPLYAFIGSCYFCPGRRKYSDPQTQ